VVKENFKKQKFYEKIMIKYRKFKKSDIRQVTKIRHKVFSEFCKNDYFEKWAIKWYLSHSNLNKTDELLLKQFWIEKDLICYVVEENSKIIGYIKGYKNRIWNFFILWNFHNKWIWKKLIKLLEIEVIKDWANEIKIKSSTYAVPFYQKMGYKKTTWIRNMHWLKIQPMKKIF